MSSKDHWESVYTTKAPAAVSWYQEHAERSLQIVQDTDAPLDSPIIDVGGGASTLVDGLLKLGYTNLSVLDLSAAALGGAQTRLGAAAARVKWIEADITKVELPVNGYAIWHDRAVFHFLVSDSDREAYTRNVMRSVQPGGHVIIAAFAEDGPTQCSGLPVKQYRADSLHQAFGDSFELVSHSNEDHHTPFGTVQKFLYCYCVKKTF